MPYPHALKITGKRHRSALLPYGSRGASYTPTMAKKSGETIDVARVISTGQDRKTGHAIVRLRAG